MENQDSVYEPPKSDLGTPSEVHVPDEIAKKIKGGWIAALISGLLTLAFTLIAVFSGMLSGLFDFWTMIDVVLIFGLAFGIYKKSRFASTFMFVYFLLSKIWIMTETGKPNGIVLGLIFLYFYFQAMVGTYQYHKHTKSQGG